MSISRVLILCGLIATISGTQLAVTYMWHLDQPIYWPAASRFDNNTYQFGWESMTYKDQQGGHPENQLSQIFGKADRQAVYQYRAKDSINSVQNAPKFGAQMDYPGELVENVQSFASHNSEGYSNGWNSAYTQMRSETQSGGFPKLEMVGFPYHHSMGPLMESSAYYKEIMMGQIVKQKTFGSDVPLSKGFFPAEMAFSERLIPNLVKAGYEWVIVSNSHISRACENYPYSIHGDNNTPPNKSDQVNPSQDNWFEMSISRGCTPNNAYPYSFRPHYAKYVDPETGNEDKIIVVPAAQAMGWQDGYECYSTNDMDKIAGSADPEHPILVLLAHDGDNAFGGGYSYYMQCVPNLMGQAVSKGYEPTTIPQYLKDYPVDEDDVVHVEDGPWVNAAGDFGDPTFENWDWPLFQKDGTFSVPDGWSTKTRHYAIEMATNNWCETAEQVSGGVDLNEVQAPTSSATPAEKAWHFYLPTLNSGYEYYGMNNLDMCLKTSVGGNIATWWAQQALQGDYTDTTAPSMWPPYRIPYNPGGYQMGPLSKYQYTKQPTDFYIYTFAYDVSDIESVVLSVRTDNDGVNPLSENFNEVYLSNNDYVSDWKNTTMTGREFAKGNVYDMNGPCFSDDMEPLPNYIADEYYAYVTGYTNALLDYFITATDTKGNVKKSDIYHVWVGNNTSTDGESGERAFLSFD